MDKSETEQLDDIHEEVRGSHAQLGAINERTRNIESQIDSLADEVEDNQEDVNELQDKVKRNTTIIGGATGGLSMVLLWISDKVTRIL
jgi:predicted  nucleic acid-binding Zn-ribbon protein